MQKWKFKSKEMKVLLKKFFQTKNNNVATCKIWQKTGFLNKLNKQLKMNVTTSYFKIQLIFTRKKNIPDEWIYIGNKYMKRITNQTDP